MSLMRTTLKHRQWLLSLLIAVLVFGVYLALPQQAPSGDNYGYFLGAKSLAEEGNIDLDEFSHPVLKMVTKQHNGHLYSTFPIGPAIVLYPLFRVVKLLDIAISADKLAAFAANLFGAVTCSLLVLLLSRIVGHSWAILLALGLAFASPVFSNCATDFWSHVPALLFICISIHLTFRPSTTLTTLGLGLSSALAVGSRPFHFIPVAILLFFWLPQHRLRSWLLLGIPIAIMAVAGALLGLATSGHLAGAYATAQVSEGFGDPALWSFLLSPSRGILIYFPLLLLALGMLIRRTRSIPPAIVANLYGMWRRLRGSKQPELPLAVDDMANASVLIVLVGTLFYSFWWAWDGGWCYGCRFASDLAPWALISTAVLLREKPQSKRIRVLTLSLLLLGFGANFPGAFTGSGQWCAETQVKDVWSFERSQVYCAWRSLLGLENEQLLIRLDAELRYDSLRQPWAWVRYKNPTRPRCIRSWIGLWGRNLPNERFTFCQLVEGPSTFINRGDSRLLKLPLARCFELSRYREIRLYFAFTGNGFEKASNVASVTFVRP